MLGVGLQNNRICKEGASMSACLVQLPHYLKACVFSDSSPLSSFFYEGKANKALL